MAITFDAKSHSTENVDSWSHTCAADATLLVVLAANREKGLSVTGITYNGTALTKAIRNQEPNEDGAVEIWYLENPDSGTNTVAVTWSDTNEDRDHVAASFKNTDTSSPLDQTASADGTNATPSVSITPTTDNQVIVGVAFHETNKGLTVGSGETDLYGLDLGPWSIGTSYVVQTSASAQTVDFTSQDSAPWAIAAASFTSSSIRLNVSDSISLSENINSNLTHNVIAGKYTGIKIVEGS